VGRSAQFGGGVMMGAGVGCVVVSPDMPCLMLVRSSVPRALRVLVPARVEVVRHVGVALLSTR
jgi:hypothetical protein